MAREIQRTRRTQTVSPSGTASRMGVVDVYTPNVSQMFNVAADTMNTLAENQVKILDAKWQNNFETETTKYLNNKVDSILKSGEKPDLSKFQEEADGYINGVLSNVPERLSIGAEAYFNQKNLNAFETLRKQANIIEYQELSNSYQNNLESTLLNVDTFLQNNALTSKNPQETIDGINNFFATQVTSFLGSHAEKYNAMKIASEFKLNDKTQKEAEQGLMLSLEQKRVNAIIKSFFQNIDVTNVEEVTNAENEAQMFLRNYSLNEGGVRGVNYEIFEDETGNKIGQDIIDKIVGNGINTFNSVKSLNDFGLSKAKRKKQAEDIDFISRELDKISDVGSPILQNENVFIENINGVNQPMSMDGIREYLDSNNIVYTETNVEDFYNKNIASLNIRKSIGYAFDTDSKISLVEELNKSENKKYLDELNLTADDVVKSVIGNMIPELEDNIEGYRNITEEQATFVYPFMRENEVLSKGAEQLLNSMTQTKLFDLLDEGNSEEINKWVDEVLPQWKALTDNGIIKYSSINKDSNSLFLFFDDLLRYKEPLDVAQSWRTYQDTKVKNQSILNEGGSLSASNSAKSFFSQLENLEDYSVTKNFLEAERNKQKKRYGSGQVSSTYNLYVAAKVEENIERVYDPDYIQNLDAIVYNEAKKLTQFEIGNETDPNVINNIFNQNVAKVMEMFVNENDYGTTRFAPNTGSKFAFAKDSMEKVHFLDEQSAINYTVSFVRMFIEDEYDINEDLRNAFQVAGIETKPTAEDLFHMAEDGAIEMMRIEGTNDYRVKFNLDFSRKFDAYAYADESIEVKVNGNHFNPSKMFNKRFTTYVNEQMNKYVEDNNIRPEIAGLSKKFVSFFKTTGVPFDDTDFRKFDKEFQDKIIDIYETSANDFAFEYSNIMTNQYAKDPNEAIDNFLITNAKKIHQDIFEEGSMPDTFDTLEDNVQTIIEAFPERLKSRPGQVAFLLDLYNVYQPDINELKKAVKKGNVDDLFKLFPEMGDYQKRVLTYTFSKEYYETN